MLETECIPGFSEGNDAEWSGHRLCIPINIRSLHLRLFSVKMSETLSLLEHSNPYLGKTIRILFFFFEVQGSGDLIFLSILLEFHLSIQCIFLILILTPALTHPKSSPRYPNCSQIPLFHILFN